jgi:hypothetical protein
MRVLLLLLPLQVDCYALGCLLLECVQGERPWKGCNMVQVAYQVGMGWEAAACACRASAISGAIMACRACSLAMGSVLSCCYAYHMADEVITDMFPLLLVPAGGHGGQQAAAACR